MKKKQLNHLIFCFLGTVFFFAIETANASDYRFIVGLGFGGSGIKRDSSTTSVVTGTVQRSEGPGVIDLGVERIISDQLIVSISHARGFRLAPVSSGVGFTGVFGRYYFSPVYWGTKELAGKTTLWVKRLQPYVGAGVGIASGSIDRTGDLVPTLSASGLFLGLRLGADLPLNKTGFGLRSEIATSFTGSSKPPEPSSLTLFSVGCSVFFQW